jgi:hypothetical protein
LEGVGVLGIVTPDAGLLGRQRADVLGRGIVGVDAAGAVADLALNGLQLLVLDDLAATRLAKARDVAAHARQIELLVVVDQRLVGPEVTCGLPVLDRLGVAGIALFDADVAGLALARWWRLHPGEERLVALGDPGVVGVERLLGGIVDRQLAGDLDLLEGHDRIALELARELLLEACTLVLEARDEGRVCLGVGPELGDAFADPLELLAQD